MSRRSGILVIATHNRNVRLRKCAANRNALRGCTPIVDAFLWRILLGVGEARNDLAGRAPPTLVIGRVAKSTTRPRPLVFTP